MARIRCIKPEFPQSQSVGRLSRDARLLFIQLWTIADDEGRCRAASRALASLLYPYDDDAPKLIGKWLGELEREGMIRRYEVDGNDYLEIVKWLSHQKIDRPSKSRIPPFDEASRALANDREPSSGDREGIKEGKGSRTIAPIGAGEDVFEARFWKPYPRKVGKGAALKAWRAACKTADPEQIIAGLARFRWPDEPKFIPHPATWLNAQRWLDEPPEVRAGPVLARGPTLAEARAAAEKDRAEEVPLEERQRVGEMLGRLKAQLAAGEAA